MDFDSL